jgi:ribosome biogenesis GTPase A
VRVLNLTIPKEIETETFTWTPYEICEQYALKRKYRAKGGFADAFRGANEILRRHLEGKYGQFWGPTEL